MVNQETVQASKQRHMHIPLAALHAVEATKSYFEQPSPPHEVDGLSIELTKHERTAEGFIELGWEHLETQRSLHLDLRYACDGPLATWPKAMQDRAEQAVARMNADRESPLVTANLSPAFLFRIAEPRWANEAKEGRITEWPEEFHADLEMLAELDDKLRILSQDKSLQKEAKEIWHTRSEVMKVAAGIDRNEQKQAALTRRIAELRMQTAAVPGQRLSAGKHRQIDNLEAEIAELKASSYNQILVKELIPDIVEEVERRTRKRVRAEYERGLIMTDSMQALLYEAVPSLIKGNPALLVGETGGAKTALAKYIAREIMGKEPEIISGYADVNGYQLIGKTGLTTKDGATISEFVAGPVIRAMQEGRPLILDEINAMPPEFLKRLNEITQLRPGDTMSIQEDSGKVITVAQGFCIIATANEKSRRYQGVHDLSTEFINRFTANTYRVQYPDANVVVGQDPLDNYKLAYGAACDEAGNLLFEEGADTLEKFARAAHLTQRLFSRHINEGLSQEELDVVGTNRLSDPNATGLDDNVIAPRTMAALIEKVVDSHGSLTLQQVLERWLESIKNPHDKKVMTLILTSRHLLGSPEVEDEAA
ncbi:MAG: AAA family ATPase [Candidatus Saccharimonas sp.]